MGRVSTCQKNCNTIDLRRAQVNQIKETEPASRETDVKSIISYQNGGNAIELERILLFFLAKCIYYRVFSGERPVFRPRGFVWLYNLTELVVRIDTQCWERNRVTTTVMYVSIRSEAWWCGCRVLDIDRIALRSQALKTLRLVFIKRLGNLYVSRRCKYHLHVNKILLYRELPFY